MSASQVDSGGHERDSADLARFGYKQELKRSLGVFSSFAVAFSYISPSTGIFTLFALGLTTLGGVFIWTWPVVALGQFIVALNFAEVSSHYPVAGSVFQWTKYLAGRSYSWFTGWIYLFAGILTVTAVVATLPLALIPALNGLGWHSLNAGSLHTQEAVALITLVVITVLNIYGVRLVALINNTGVLFEILGMFVFALVLMAFHNHQGFHVVTNSAGFKVGPSSFLAAMFMSLFVIYGFDTAATLSEETKDPRRAAPKAVLFSVVGAFVIGGVFLLGTLVAIPNLHGAITGNGGLGFGPAQIIEANFSSGFATLYLLVVSAAIFVCCLSIMAATIRLCFGMSRDNQLPWSGALSKVAPRLHTPVWSCLVVAVLSAVPFLKYSGAATIAIAATGMIYLSYFLGNIVIMRARAKGWPKVRAPFRLGRWGIGVNVVALLYGGAMLVNFAWPRAASNPKPEQTGGLLSFGWSFLNKIPILWTVVIGIAVIGAVYYFAAGRRRSFAPVIPPAEEVPPATEAPAARGAVMRRLQTLAGMPPKIARGPGTTVHTQIEDWLAGAIAAGRVTPGDRLPAEQDLAAWFGVSRMTLRHALGELARRGLVTRTVGRGGGTFVAEPKLEQDLTTLAGFSEQLRRHGMTPGARVLAATEHQAGPATAAALQIGEEDLVYGVRRIRLADGRPLVLEHSLFPAVVFPGMLNCRLDGSLYELLEDRFGQRPHHARERLEPVTASVREAEALEVEVGAPLMLVERTAYSRTGEPLEFARDLFRGDKIRVVVWTSELAGAL